MSDFDRAAADELDELIGAVADDHEHALRRAFPQPGSPGHNLDEVHALRRLQELRRDAWDRYQDALGRMDRAGTLRASEARELDRLEGVIGRATDAIEQAQLLQVDRSQIPDGGGNVNDNDSRSFHTPDEFRQWLRTGDANEMRALGVGVDAEGGFLVPEGFRRRVAEALKSFGGVRQVAEIITTNNGQDLPFPTSDDTANVGAILAENTAVTEQDVTLGQVKLLAFMYTSKLVRASFQVLEDSGIDIESFLARRLAERIGRAQNAHFTTGTGTGQPQGVQTNAAVGKTGGSGQTTSVTYDDLVDLLHSVDPAYREGDGVGWMLRDTTLSAIRKLKDADQRPLLEPDVKAGVPNTLLGFRVQVNNDMPAMAASAKSILFGNFRRGYVIRDVRGLRVLQLRERYADFLQVGFLGFVRADGRVQDSAAVKAYANAAI